MSGQLLKDGYLKGLFVERNIGACLVVWLD